MSVSPSAAVLIVCDASALVALLVDSGSAGSQVADALSGAAIAAPALCHFEATNVIRRHERFGTLSSDVAAQAIADLLELPIEEWPYRALAHRAWELRANLSSYDASYVALAELLGTELLTLDRRIARAPGLRCAVRVAQ